MAARGGKRDGAGRRSNAEKALDAQFLCKAFSQSVQEIKWNQFLNSDDENVQLKAAIYLTDRLYGKPKQQTEVTGKDGGPIDAEIVVTLVRPDGTRSTVS
jgi:hypothetical protein